MIARIPALAGLQLLTAFLEPPRDGIGQPEHQDRPQSDHTQCDNGCNAGGAEERRAHLAHVHLRHQAELKFADGLMGSQHRHAPVVGADQPSALAGQGPPHGLRTIRVEWNGPLYARSREPEVQEENDLALLTPAQYELARLAEPAQVGMRIDHLTYCGGPGALRMVLLAVHRVEAGDRFDEPGLHLDHYLELLRLLIEIVAVEERDHERHDHRRNDEHHRDGQVQNPHLIV